ncbi:MAG: alpha/beta hydrolase [Dehalococcoidia bacterium]|nr:MAG: alpha/beta hydrolase [Dehalococcoidia bacterium]
MKIIICLILFITICIAGIRYIERKSIYFPMRQITSTPSAVGLDYKEVYFNTSDGKKIHTWFVPNDEADYTILFSHGNAGNIGHRLDKIKILHDIGLNVLIYDYRGYGKSQGTPSEQGMYKDVYAAYDYLVNEMGISHDSLILYGESIGGAVAIELAHHRPVGALITEEAFTSVKDMVQMAFPLIPYFIFSSRFDNLPKIGNIKCEKLIIHSIDDEIIPFSQGNRLFNTASEPKKFLKLRGGHNTAFWDSIVEYKEGIRSFVESLSYDGKKI